MAAFLLEHGATIPSPALDAAAAVLPDCHSDHESAKLAGLLAYWRGKCAGRKMPRRSDIDPTEIPSFLPEVFIAEIHDPLRFRFRLVGSRICERWNENYTGKWLDELDLGAEQEAALEQYTWVAETGQPRCDHVEFESVDGRYLCYWRLLMPLSEDGCIPHMIIGMQLATSSQGLGPQRTKWI